MKGFLMVIVIVAGLFTGCNRKSESPEVLTILTSFYPMYIMTLNVTSGVSNVRVVNMTPPQTGCLHDYQITTADMKAVERATILVVNGAGMEAFLDQVVVNYPKLKIVTASSNIPLLESAPGEESNPHLWVSITLAIREVRNIAEQLATLDPQHSDRYLTNSMLYIRRLEELRARMHNALDGLPNRDIVTFHEAFPYFAQEFNLRIVAVVEREPGSEPGAGELAATIQTVKSLKVKSLFAEPQYSTKSAQTIARETGAKVYSLDPAVSGPMTPNAYILIMESNLAVLQDALK